MVFKMYSWSSCKLTPYLNSFYASKSVISFSSLPTFFKPMASSLATSVLFKVILAVELEQTRSDLKLTANRLLEMEKWSTSFLYTYSSFYTFLL